MWRILKTCLIGGTAFLDSVYMITIFYWNAIISSECLIKGSSIQPEIFAQSGSTIAVSVERLSHRKKAAVTFIVHMDNSPDHNARKISMELEHNTIERTAHSACSPEISLCDSQLFDFLKEKIQGTGVLDIGRNY
jgi:hypothetical protein